MVLIDLGARLLGRPTQARPNPKYFYSEPVVRHVAWQSLGWPASRKATPVGCAGHVHMRRRARRDRRGEPRPGCARRGGRGIRRLGPAVQRTSPRPAREAARTRPRSSNRSNRARSRSAGSTRAAFADQANRTGRREEHGFRCAAGRRSDVETRTIDGVLRSCSTAARTGTASGAARGCGSTAIGTVEWLFAQHGAIWPRCSRCDRATRLTAVRGPRRRDDASAPPGTPHTERRPV